MLARQCLTRVSRRGFCAAAVADHSKLDDEIAKIAARAAGTTGLSSPRDSRKVVGIADAKGGVAASGDSVGPQWGTVSEFVRDDAGLRGRFHTALQQISDSVKPYTNVKPAAAIDWAAMDAKIQTPGVVAAYKAAVESIKVEPIDPSPILKSLHAKYDKLVKDCDERTAFAAARVAELDAEQAYIKSIDIDTWTIEELLSKYPQFGEEANDEVRRGQWEI